MGFLTNKVDVSIDYDALFSDFDIYCIQPDANYTDKKKADRDFFRGRCVVDSALYEMKALSTAYNRNDEAFLLFPKTDVVRTSEFREKVKSIYPSFTGTYVRKSMFEEESVGRLQRFYYGDRILVQLLFNSLANYTDEFRFHNLEASLMRLNKMFPVEHDGSVYHFRIYIEYRITAGMYLKLAVRSFHTAQGKNSDEAPYVFDPTIGDLRKRLPSDDASYERFVNKSVSGHHSHIPFLDFSGLNAFRNSRAGCLFEFIEEVHSRLGKYITITPKRFEENTSWVKSEYLDTEHCFEAVRNHFQSKNIVLQNHIGASGELLLSKLDAELSKQRIPHRIASPTVQIQKNQPAIILLHEKDWYENHEANDPYLKLHASMNLLQVATDHEIAVVNDLKKERDKERAYTAICLNLLKELWIKDDLQRGKFTFPKDLSYLTRPWYFVIAKKQPIENRKRMSREETIFTFFRMRLDPDGRMTFDSFTNQQECFLDVKERIMDAFQMCPGEEYLAQGETVEGVLYCDEENLHKIIRTNWWALPNLRDISFALQRNNQNQKLSRERVVSALTSFKNMHAEFADDAETAIQSVHTMNKFFTLKELRKLSGEEQLSMKSPKGSSGKTSKVFGGGKKWVKAFAAFFLLHENVLIAPAWKESEDTKTLPFSYGFDDVAGIQSFQHQRILLRDHIKNGEQRVTGYFTGIRRSRLKLGYPRGSVLRDIVSEPGCEDQSADILPLLDVDFVTSNDMFTVLPFPFKFLREYAVYCEQHGIQPSD